MSYTNAKTHHPCPWGRGTISLTRFLPPSFPLSLHLDAIKEVKALVARLYAEMKVMAVRIDAGQLHLCVCVWVGVWVGFVRVYIHDAYEIQDICT
jgi:hypothetical protein